MLSKRHILLAVAVLMGAATAIAQHWTCHPQDYRYDMTMYARLVLNGSPVTNYSGMEVAAFVGDECRGVMEPQQLEVDGQTVTYGYMRLRSNQASGETFTFRMYNSTTDQEVTLTPSATFTFESMGIQGLPSNPILLSASTYLVGDVNRDGDVTVTDVTALVDIILGGDAIEPFVYDHVAADLNGDHTITITDVTALVNIILGKI